jgi:hypothetical protein
MLGELSDGHGSVPERDFAQRCGVRFFIYAQARPDKPVSGRAVPEH